MSGVYVIGNRGGGVSDFPSTQATLIRTARLYPFPDANSTQIVQIGAGTTISYLSDFIIIGFSTDDSDGDGNYDNANFYLAKYEDNYGFILASTING